MFQKYILPIGQVIVLLLFSSVVFAASSSPLQEAPKHPKQKILWVDSYNEGYEWSAGIEKGIRRVLASADAELTVVRMDTRRNPTEKFKQETAEKAKKAIDIIQPDVVIASDDNAVKYLVVPYLKDTVLPVVFCGVNWDASPYDLPGGNVAGMLEIDHVEAQVMHLSRYAKSLRIGYLSGDTETERKIIDIYNRRFFNGQLKSYLVTTFKDFQDQFLLAQQEVDMLYIYNYAGIVDWDASRAEKFLLNNAQIPTGSHNVFMAPFVLVTLAKLPQEQGEWAAQTALRILSGIDPADIPLAVNEKGRLIINFKMAQTLGVVFPLETLRAAEGIGQDSLQ